ncbi:hypothetical protein DYB28_015937 [Aphanomyces astaci]|uniref:Uncharacterized protein n=1 Tax=Aphanomyces astaci TaxID=112090 RepID=A0A9X8DQ88_APHAT|nr:hypothetical protein DYB28_015937 [Aphanomyces astaci]
MEKPATDDATIAPAPSSDPSTPVKVLAVASTVAATTPADGVPQPKRRGRPPKVRDPDELDKVVKRPRGRPRNPDKLTASWCPESVKLLFYLRYDSDLRQKFDEKDNRSKRTGYELLASTLSDKIGRKFDNAQVQQKLSQLGTVWAKLDPKDDEATRPQHWDVMNEYWGPGSKFPQPQLQPPIVPRHQINKRDSADSDYLAPPAVTSSTLSTSFLEAVVPALSSSLAAVQPHKLRRILSKHSESDEAVAATDVHSAAAAAVSSSAAQSDQGDSEATLISGFLAVKEGLVAISSAIAGHGNDDKMDVLVAAVAKQTHAIEQQSKQLAALVDLLSTRHQQATANDDA